MTSTQIARLRRQLGLNQVQFAELFGVHPITVSKWERNILVPNGYQKTLMISFMRASKDAGTKNKLPEILTGDGLVAAVFFLLSRAR